MKIIIYCQHVLGVGHFFRTLEICRALDQHQVVLVSGGPETPAPLPPHVRRLQLPELAMDHAFQNLHTTDGQSVTQTRASRRAMLEAASSGDWDSAVRLERERQTRIARRDHRRRSHGVGIDPRCHAR